MLTAFLVQVGDNASIRLTAGGHHVATYHLTADDGPGPVPAATAVLAAHGWRLVDDWHQESGGISGGQWTAHAEQAPTSPGE